MGSSPHETVASTPVPHSEEVRLPAPAGSPSTVAEKGAARWDRLRAGLVVVLGFFLASFPAVNSDAWRHLATGRALLEGNYHFGTDPFCYTTEGHYWTNPSWLADLLAYGTYQAIGGTGLVIVKALLLALLAELLLRTCRQPQKRWLAALVVGLALVAMAPYLALRPVCLSFLLLGFTVWWLERASRFSPSPQPSLLAGEGETGGPAWRRALAAYWPLLLAFALWANLDEWFLLGPLTAGLYALGAALEALHRPGAPCRATQLGLLTVAGLIVCLANPHHIHVFALPAALDPSLSAELLGEVLGPGQGLSPFQPRSWRLGPTPALAAYAVLLLAGLVSFLLNLGRWRWAHALVWLVFGLLSAYRAAAIPFFAIVAGPITATNWQAYLVQRPSRARSLGRRALWGGQLATLAILLGAVIAAWGGWLQAPPLGPRSWALEMSPSLKAAANRLPLAGQGLNLSPAAADCLAWLCPQEKGFLDSRLRAFPEKVTKDFLALRRVLVPSPLAKPKADVDWQAILRDYGITHLIVYDPNDARLIPALGTALEAPAQWRLIGLDGKAALLSWQKATRPLALAEIDLGRLAFRPTKDQRAPRSGPKRPPEPRSWREAFCKPLPTPTEEGDAALAYLVYFDARGPATRRASQLRCVNGLAASVVGLALCESAPLAWPALDLRLALFQPRSGDAETAPWGDLPGQFWFWYGHRQDDGPPAALYLAVRAARRALAIQPDDPVVHYRLGQAYFRLLHNTRERSAAPAGSALERLRQVQTITALAAAVRLRPDYAEAHRLLQGVYLNLGYLDLALHHLREYLKHSQPVNPVEEKLRRQQQELADKLNKEVNDRLHEADTAGYGKTVLDRALIAEQKGLPGRALEILLAADSVSLGRSGALEELQLLLFAGRTPEVREFLDSEAAEFLAGPVVAGLRAQLAAAEGNYKQADQELAALILPQLKRQPGLYRSSLALLAGTYLLDRAMPLRLSPYVITQEDLLSEVAATDQTFRGQVDLLTVRGLLALEAGYVDQARDFFTEAVSIWRPSDGDALARHYRELLLSTK
jgi:hypothetical protein